MSLLTDPPADVPPAPADVPPSDTPPSDPPPADPKAGDAPPADPPAPAPADPPPGPPDAYAPFKVGDAALPDELQAEVAAFAKDLGLTQEAAQKLAEREAGLRDAAGKAGDAKVAEIQAKFAEQRAAWEAEVKADKVLGGDKLGQSIATAKRGLETADPSGALSKLLAETGFGSHPQVIAAFHRIGQLVAEDSFVKGQPAATEKPKSAADVLYDKTN